MNPDDPDYGNDSDRTVIKPMPGGRRKRSPQATPRPAPAGGSSERFDQAMIRGGSGGRNVLIDAAGTLLSVVGRLRGSTSHPDVNTLRLQVEQEVMAFEQAARAGSKDPEEVATARYLLCTLIDETVLGTPWGNESIWNQQTLLAKYHREAWGGEKFFNILDHLQREPSRYIDLLELTYLCLLLGFEGKYKVQERGSDQLRSIQENLYITIRQRQHGYEQELSPHWQGIVDQRNPLVRYVPFWVLGAVLALLLLLIFFGFRLSLNSAAGPVYQQLDSVGRQAPLVADVQRVAEAAPVQTPRLTNLLAAELKAGMLTISDRPDSTRLVVIGDGLFRSGSADVNKSYYPLLESIAEALDQFPGRVQVVGHTDNVPMRSLRFSSNWDLSRQRAAAVAQLLADATGAGGRFHAEGRADTEPLVPNDSAANRAQNRRVEIIIFKETGKI